MRRAILVLAGTLACVSIVPGRGHGGSPRIRQAPRARRGDSPDPRPPGHDRERDHPRSRRQDRGRGPRRDGPRRGDGAGDQGPLRDARDHRHPLPHRGRGQRQRVHRQRDRRGAGRRRDRRPGHRHLPSARGRSDGDQRPPRLLQHDRRPERGAQDALGPAPGQAALRGRAPRDQARAGREPQTLELPQARATLPRHAHGGGSRAARGLRLRPRVQAGVGGVREEGQGPGVEGRGPGAPAPRPAARGPARRPRRQDPRARPLLPRRRDPHAPAGGRRLRLQGPHAAARPRGLQGGEGDRAARGGGGHVHRLVGLQARGLRRHSLQPGDPEAARRRSSRSTPIRTSWPGASTGTRPRP